LKAEFRSPDVTDNLNPTPWELSPGDITETNIDAFNHFRLRVGISSTDGNIIHSYDPFDVRGWTNISK